MNNHPKVPFTVSRWVHVLNAFSAICLISTIIYIFLIYPTLPDTIPIHFNAQGEADNWGSKLSVFAMPAIALFMFIGLYFLSKFPHIYNYPITITEENASRVYSEANLFMTIFNLEIVLIFVVASFDVMGQFLGIWFVIVVFGVPLLTLGLFVVKLLRITRSERSGNTRRI